MSHEAAILESHRVVLEGVGDVSWDAGGVVRGRGVGEAGGQRPGLHHPQVAAYRDGDVNIINVI